MRLLRVLRPRAIRAILWLLPLLLSSRPALAGPGDADADSVYLVGEFVDPVCIFQHGMQGALQKQCALVRGRVEQGMFFLDIRQRRLYTVIGQTHWEDPRQGFLDALGDTFAVRGKVWRRAGSAAIAITGVWPYRAQPEPTYRWWPWHWEWTVLAGCGLLGALYVLGLTVLPKRLRLPPPRVEAWRAAPFLGGLAIVILALNGPLHDLSDRYLFSAHMVQHLLLAEVFPPLLLIGLPAWLIRWLFRKPWVRALWSPISSVPMGAVLYTLVFSLWHVPPLYNLMMRNHDFHILMHLMLMATAVLTWWPVIGGAANGQALSSPAKMLYLFLLGTPMMAVAALITFPGHALYEWYDLAPRFLGMSVVDDQRLGGLIMWVPGGLYYWGAMSVVFFRWAARESRDGDSLVTVS